ncbi:MAG: glycosyltransferase [Chlorogloeopsis fritschii C42_A2020_084]|uniref:glycosyltransferase n=1 Tax=Chlorogloeopsis fritschii TaxID=1124 RepID=UPI001A0AD8B3|nr:glycosyltransferase [Chlorogloeopsis fritschii]MBF2004230.1 glycosyltransferase [Chlorogloeopsis fritschii C42_A2020_084]
MHKKSIGMLIYANPDYYPPTVNAIHLLSNHFDIVLVGRNQDPCDRDYPSNVKVHRLGQYTTITERMQLSSRAKLWEYINFVVQSYHLLKDVSLIYAYDAFAHTAAHLHQLFLTQKVPLVYHNHEISEHLFPLSSFSRWIQRAEQLWVNQAAIAVFPDQDRADFFQKFTHLKKEPIIVPNFPLKSFFEPPKNWSSLIKKRWEEITLFYRGSISDTSAMQDIVTAASLLNKSVKIKFVGFLTASNAEKLQNWVEHLKMSTHFSYLGTLPYKDLQAPTLSATVGFGLYKNTSFDRVACATACNKIYEYAACGVPTIVSNFPTYREYLAKETWIRFADPDDPQSIASAIQDILSDFDKYQAMCLAARKAFEEKYNYESAFYPLLSKIKDLVK